MKIWANGPSLDSSSIPRWVGEEFKHRGLLLTMGLLILLAIEAWGLDPMIGRHQTMAMVMPVWGDAPIFEESFESLSDIANHGGVYSGISIEPGRVGHAVRVDNADRLTYPSNLDPQKGTIRFWLSPSWAGDATTEPHYFFEWRAGDARMRIFTWYFASSGKNYLVFRLKDNAGHDHEVGTMDIMAWEADQWHEVILFWDFTGTKEFFGMALDGWVAVNDEYDWAFTDTPTTFSVGSDTYGESQADARIDELRIYDESIWELDNIIDSYKRVTCGQGKWDPHETVHSCPEDTPTLDPAIHPGETYMFYETAPFTAVYEGTVPASSAITDIITYQAAQNDVEPLFFNVYTRADLQDVHVTVTDFVGPNGSRISTQDAELRVVHNWWQAGTGPLKKDYPAYVPELLLYDDTIDLEGQAWDYDTLPSMPPLDHVQTSLQAYTSKQFVLILPIPNDVAPGHYTATVTVTPANEVSKTLTLDLEVLPFALQENQGNHLIYLTADIDHPNSQYYLSMERFEAQLADIKRHGFNGATIYGEPGSDNIPLKLQKIKDAGLTKMVVLMTYYQDGVALLENNGYEPYFYGIDEPTRNHDAYMDDHIALSQTIHEGGGKVTTAITKRGEEMLKDCNNPIYSSFPPGTCEPLDMANLSVEASLDYLEDLINGGASKEDFETYYWQIMQEDPRINRFLAGFFLWNTGLDGIFPYVYQDVRHNPYDDFDEWSSVNPYRDHLVTYPSQQGPVPTIQWEALREGLDDFRYLQTWRAYKTRAEAYDPAAAQASAQVIADVLAHYNRYEKIQTTPLAQYRDDRRTIAQETLKMQQAATAIGDLVWWDIDRDGIQDPGEPGIPNVALSLSGTASDSTTTDASGVYTFANLSPGTYTITVDASNFTSGPLQNWTASPQDQGGDESRDSDGDPTDHDVSLTLGVNETNPTIDFGFTITTSYTLTKHLNTSEPVRPGAPISFTIRITDTGKSWLATLPLEDTYNTGYLTYGAGGHYAQPDSDDHENDGQIDWSDVLDGTPLAPGQSRSVIVHFTARADTTSLPDGKTKNIARAHNGTADPDGPSGPLGALESLPEKSDSDKVSIVIPTGVVLSSFAAHSQEGGVALTWRTENESRILGFRVWRAMARRDGGFTAPIQVAFIPARHAGMATGDLYRFEDLLALRPGRYRYWLEVVRVDGTTYRLGPEDAWVTHLSRPITTP